MAQTKTPFYAWFGSVMVMVFDHPDDVNAVFASKSCLAKPYIIKYMGFETALALASGNIEIWPNSKYQNCGKYFVVDVWKSMRKPLCKAFNPKILESFIPIFNGNVKLLIRNLEEKVNKDEFDITPIVFKCMLDMLTGEFYSMFVKERNYVSAPQKERHSE